VFSVSLWFVSAVSSSLITTIPALAILSSCAGSKLPTASIDVGGHPLTVEVAATGQARQQGLMHRDHLGADRGMLFVYPDVAIRHFWMKDTRLPLSIAFVDATGKVLRLADMQPLNTDHTSSLYPVKYALEVNKGWFEQNGVLKGAVISGLDALPLPEGGPQ
jgi:uncharacterized membrane protein (UPF0127 family)